MPICLAAAAGAALLPGPDAVIEIPGSVAADC
jgi:hypothetical protein